MKNIFDYATKELSQDAFLCWLFDNYDCKNEKVAEIAVKLLSSFSLELSAGKIKNLHVFKQWKYIDVLVRFEYENKTHIIAIEDKTFSEEHEQLKNYNDELDEYIKSVKGEVQCHKVFYKTAVLYEQENKRVDKANGWEIFDIRRIYNFFSQYSDTGSDILNDYIAHVIRLYNMLYNYKEIDFDNWIGNNFIFKQYCDIDIRQKAGGDFSRSEIYQGKYTAAYLQKITKNNIVVELAFFFRDSQFCSWVKCWENGMKHDYVNPILRKQIVSNIPNELDVQWEHCMNRNRILRSVNKPFGSFSDLDNWVDNCLHDFRTIKNHLQSIKI